MGQEPTLSVYKFPLALVTVMDWPTETYVVRPENQRSGKSMMTTAEPITRTGEQETPKQCRKHCEDQLQIRFIDDSSALTTATHCMQCKCTVAHHLLPGQHIIVITADYLVIVNLQHTASHYIRS